MRVYNKYVLALVLAASLINTLLAFGKQDDLEVYFIINVIAYLIITLLFVYLNPRARKSLSAVGAALFTGFMVIVTLRVMEILGKR